MAVATAMTRGRRWTAALALAAVALGGAACGSDDDDTATFCEGFRQFEDDLEQTESQFEEAPDEAGLDDAKQVFTDMAAETEELAGEAPDEIAEDFGVIDDRIQQVADDVEAAETPDEILEAVLGLAEDAEETEDSGQRVDEWIEDSCDSDGAK